MGSASGAAEQSTRRSTTSISTQNYPLDTRLDWRAIQVSVRLPAFYWVLSMVLVTLFGYPGVVGTTPGGWLLSLPVGKRCLSESRSPQRSQKLREAAIAGALLGLLQGIVFTVGLLTTPALADSGRENAAWLCLAITLAGILICALLSAATAAFFSRK